jgi:hypothetical protein
MHHTCIEFRNDSKRGYYIGNLPGKIKTGDRNPRCDTATMHNLCAWICIIENCNPASEKKKEGKRVWCMAETRLCFVLFTGKLVQKRSSAWLTQYASSVYLWDLLADEEQLTKSTLTNSYILLICYRFNENFLIRPTIVAYLLFVRYSWKKWPSR